MGKSMSGWMVVWSVSVVGRLVGGPCLGVSEGYVVRGCWLVRSKFGGQVVGVGASELSLVGVGPSAVGEKAGSVATIGECTVSMANVVKLRVEKGAPRSQEGCVGMSARGVVADATGGPCGTRGRCTAGSARKFGRKPETSTRSRSLCALAAGRVWWMGSGSVARGMLAV